VVTIGTERASTLQILTARRPATSAGADQGVGHQFGVAKGRNVMVGDDPGG